MVGQFKVETVVHINVIHVMHAKSYINQILKIDLNLKLESHAKSDADCLLDFSDDFYTKSYTKPYPI